MSRNLKLIEKINTELLNEIRSEILANNDLFTDSRALSIDFHRYTKHIPLRGPVTATRAKNRIFSKYQCFVNGIESINSKYAASLPKTMSYLEDFAKRNESVLGRAQVVLLSGNREVFTHVDYGYYYGLHDRYHLVIDSLGSEMESGGEVKTYTNGDLFFYENRLPHSARNTGDSERTHIIFDTISINPFIVIYKFFKWKVLYRKYIDKSIFYNSGQTFNERDSYVYLLEALRVLSKKD